jgi:pyruvate kinase
MKTIRKTKIVCTLGPATEDIKIIENLLREGMNIARFNFSHGSHEYHKAMIARLREANANTGIPAALMLDTKGPEIRTGTLAEGITQIVLTRGREITITTSDRLCDNDVISISYRKLHEEITPGNHIFIADGLIDLRVEEVSDRDIKCRVISGGRIGSRKNVNIPGVKVSLPSITEKDTHDILFGIEQDMDFISASFIRRADHITDIQDLLSTHSSHIKVIAKIEDQEGLENIDDIIRVSAGVMVARGDLGVQLKIEDIPLVQKRIIEKCNRQNKAVITATQMLDSMIHNPKPTRAEMTDVANAIFDGTDAVMLSGETASGKYPVESVQTMHRIAAAVETSEEYHKEAERHFSLHAAADDIGQAVAKSAYLLARDVDARAIISPSLRGNSPRLISKFRPSQTIIAATTSEATIRQLLLYWGIYPVMVDYAPDSDTMIQNALKAALRHGLIKKLDKVVTAAGIPLKSPIPMNVIKVHFLGNILGRGHGGFGGSCAGRILKVRDDEEIPSKLQAEGEDNPILLCRTLKKDEASAVKTIAGLILEEESEVPIEELRSLNAGLVYISQVPNALENLEDNIYVSLNGEEKIIYEGVVEI